MEQMRGHNVHPMIKQFGIENGKNWFINKEVVDQKPFHWVSLLRALYTINTKLEQLQQRNLTQTVRK